MSSLQCYVARSGLTRKLSLTLIVPVFNQPQTYATLVRSMQLMCMPNCTDILQYTLKCHTVGLLFFYSGMLSCFPTLVYSFCSDRISAVFMHVCSPSAYGHVNPVIRQLWVDRRNYASDNDYNDYSYKKAQWWYCSCGFSCIFKDVHEYLLGKFTHEHKK